MKVASYSGSLAHLCCGEGGTQQINAARMCGECLQWMGHTVIATVQGGASFPVSRGSGSMVTCEDIVPGGSNVLCTF